MDPVPHVALPTTLPGSNTGVCVQKDALCRLRLRAPSCCWLQQAKRRGGHWLWDGCRWLTLTIKGNGEGLTLCLGSPAGAWG